MPPPPIFSASSVAQRLAPWLASWLAPILVVGVMGCADTDEDLPPPPEVPAVAPRNAAQRLTIAQYRNAIHDLFGADVAVPAALEPDTSLSGFVSIGAAESAISPRGVEQYETAAYEIAKQALSTPEKREALFGCAPKSATDEACARTFIETAGRRVWRRPLTAEEVTTFAAVTTGAAQALGSFGEGAEFGLAGLLQAPSFLYRATTGEPDPERPGELRTTGHELATRLSFFLWNSTPDDGLLALADSGEIHDPVVLEQEVDRLLASPRAKLGLRNFVTEYLRLDQLDALSKDPKIYTYYSPDVGPAAREETLLGFEHLAFDDDGDFRDIFTTRRTFVNPKLASIYQVLAPNPEGFAEVLLPVDIPRRGLLGQVAFLALYAHPTSSSATLRGKLVRQVLLCGDIPPPPVNVNTALPEPAPGALTLRDRIKIHLENPVCSACHLAMDPIGLGMESFDGLGRYRTTENGATIDPSGDLDGKPFAGPAELSELVRSHPNTVRCFARRMFEYATSTEERFEDREVVDAISAEFAASGHRIVRLMRAIALSPGLRLVSSPGSEEAQ